MVKQIKGLAAIDRSIKSLNTRLDNVLTDIQAIAVAIVEHAAGAGNGDMSRALTLCKTIKRRPTLNVAFLVGWFRYFGNANVNLSADDGAGRVSLLSKDSKAYRGGFDVDGAKHNNWFDAIDKNGNRAGWYAGPTPAEFQPLGIGDLAARMQNFVKNTAKLLTETKTVNGKEVPVVKLAEPDAQQVKNALAFIDRIAATLARHEEVEQAAKKFAEAQEAAGQDNEVVELIAPKEQAVG